MTLAKSSKPHAYPRRILLAVASHSPQIVTETIYALTQQAETACMPTEVHVISTQKGEPYIHLLLKSQPSGKGQLYRLCDDYQLPEPAFSEANIHLIANERGEVLEDIRTCADNTHAADYITRVVQTLTSDPNSSLIVSLSGGRRTMTFYVGYALSLFGRAQDRLTHVLVENEYFFNEEFFYPPPQKVWVVREDNSGFDASKVEVTLADIPFVRLREGLPSCLLEGQSSFSDTVAAAQAELAPAIVSFDAQTQALYCANQAVAMQGVELSFYTLMLQRCQRQQADVRWTDCGLGQAFLEVYASLYGKSGAYERAQKALSKGMTKEYFEQRKTRVNGLLKQALGSRLATTYLIHAQGKRPHTRYALNLSPSDINLT